MSLVTVCSINSTTPAKPILNHEYVNLEESLSSLTDICAEMHLSYLCL